MKSGGAIRRDDGSIVLGREARLGQKAGIFHQRGLGDSGRYALDASTAGTDRLIRPGRCVKFDGSNDYVDCGDLSAFDFAGPFSAVFFCKTSAVGAYGAFIGKYAGTTPPKGWDFDHDASGKVSANLRGNTSLSVTSVAEIDDGAWHQVAIVATLTTVTVYIDGVYDNANTGTWDPIAATGTSLCLGNRSASFYLYYGGYLSDVRVYNRVITPTEVAEIYADCIARQPHKSLYASSLVGHWELDEARGGLGTAPAWDSSGNGYHGAPKNITASTYYYEGADVPFSWQNAAGFSFGKTSADGTDITPATLNTFSHANWTTAVVGGAALTKVDDDTLQWVFSGASQYGYVQHTISGTVSGQSYVADIQVRCTSGSGTLLIYIDYGASGAGRIPSNVAGSFQKITVGSEWRSFTTSLDLSVNHITKLTIFCYGVDHGNTGTHTFDFRSMSVASGASTLDVPRKESSTLYDVHGKNLSYVGRAPRKPKLIKSMCATFNGSNSYVECAGRVTSGAVSAVSASAWFKSGAAASAHIIGEWTTTTNDRTFALLLVSSGVLGFYTSTDGTSSKHTDTVALYNDNAWHHVVVTYDAGTVLFYVDGLRQRTTTTGSHNPLYNGAGKLRIGGAEAGAAPFAGSLSDVRIFNYALTAAEAIALYQGTEPTTKAIGRWPLAEGSGTTTYDVSGNGHVGTCYNTTASTFWGTTQNVHHHNLFHGFSNPTAEGTYRTFNGSTQYFVINDNASLDNGAGDFWVFVHFRKNAAGSAQQSIVSKYDSGANTREWEFYSSNGQSIGFATSSDGLVGTYVSAVRGNGSITLGQWHSAFGYLDQSAGNIGLILDGLAAVESVQAAIYDGTAPLRVGTTTVSGAAWLPSCFAGDIALIAMGKGNTETLPNIQAAIYNGGNPISWESVTTANKTDWGLISWWECNEFIPKMLDKHTNANHLLGYTMPMIPALLDHTTAADASAITRRSGPWHNGAEANLDFSSGVVSPYSTTSNLPTSYAHRDAVTAPVSKATDTNHNEHDFIVSA